MSEYLRRIIRLGTLVEPAAAAKMKNLTKEDLELVVQRVRSMRPNFLTEQLLQRLLVKPIEIIKTARPKPIHGISDWVNALNSRYSAIQAILAAKTDPVSIKNCPAMGAVTVIGMVKEIKPWGIVIEDPTGEIAAVLPDPADIQADDVLAVSGFINKGRILAKKLIWPDVPQRPARSGHGRAVFLKDYTFPDALPDPLLRADYLILRGCSRWEMLKAKLPMAQIAVISNELNPALLDVGGLLVLAHFDGSRPLDILRLRYIALKDGDFVIDPVPDIFFTDARGITNYNGVTIVHGAVEVDLCTRETKLLNF
jgi:DNA polymerase II small subunit/DNA polymerase delta subunit B